MRRLFSRHQRFILRLVAGNRCENCHRPLGDNLHADHKKPFSKGGNTTLKNGAALCPACNLQKGNKN